MSIISLFEICLFIIFDGKTINQCWLDENKTIRLWFQGQFCQKPKRTGLVAVVNLKVQHEIGKLFDVIRCHCIVQRRS